MEDGDPIPLEQLEYASGLEKAYGITDELHRFYSDQQKRLSRFDAMPSASADPALLELVERGRAYLAQRGFRPTDQGNVFETLRTDFVRTTTALEGNTLSAEEVARVLEDDAVIPGKPLREHVEVVDAAQTFDATVKAVEEGRELDLSLVKELHRIVAEHLEDWEPGELRYDQRYVTGAAAYPPPPGMIEGLLTRLIAWYREDRLWNAPHVSIWCSKTYIPSKTATDAWGGWC